MLKTVREFECGMVRIAEMEDGSVRVSVQVPTSVGMHWVASPYMDEKDLWDAIVLFYGKG